MKQKYKPVHRQSGIFHNNNSGRFQARKCIDGKQYKATFDTILDAKLWQGTFDGKSSAVKSLSTSTLKEVWIEMQTRHFPTLAGSTRRIRVRWYELLSELENLRMEELTPSLITSWVERQVKFFKSDEYQNGSRGKAKRCNLDNELNLFTTIFNWYTQSECFEHEAKNLLNPVRLSHKKLGFIQAKPIKDKAITLDAALKFFSCLKPLYKDIALFQYFTASRIGETAGLQWSRIDFKNRRIVVMETCEWDDNKAYIGLNPHPKNKEPRPVHMTDELYAILKRREAFRDSKNDFVFHVDGKPLNYGTISSNYKRGVRISEIPYSGTHILRHGMAKLARQIGGGLDAVIAMTGHKDFKLADHYSKLDTEFQKETSLKIMEHIKQKMNAEIPTESPDNVVSIAKFARSK